MEDNANQDRLRVLLVDDDIDDQMLFARNLSKFALGERIVLRTLRNAQEAIDFLSESPPSSRPDLVVLDLKMTEADGFAFLNWRRSTPAFSRLPVVVLTGIEDPDELERASVLGVEASFVKPLEYEHWKEVVEQICGFGQRAKRAMERSPHSSG